MRANAVTDIVKDLVALLETTTYTHFYEVLPDVDSVAFPAVTYEFNNSFSDGADTEEFILYLDFWDKYSRTGAIAELEKMVSDVLKLLYRRKVAAADYSFRYTFDNRKNLRDPNDDIRRRRCVLTVRYFGKE